MEPDLRARLKADPAVSAASGGRIETIWRRQGDPLPALTLQKVDPGRAYTFNGADGTHGTLIQFDCWGATPLQAKTLAAALIEALEKPALVGGTQFGMSFLQSERDSSENVAGVGLVARVSVDFLVWWKRAS